MFPEISLFFPLFNASAYKKIRVFFTTSQSGEQVVGTVSFFTTDEVGSMMTTHPNNWNSTSSPVEVPLDNLDYFPDWYGSLFSNTNGIVTGLAVYFNAPNNPHNSPTPTNKTLTITKIEFTN